ncbi:helix-turn-helix domain-containing protein [Brevundimonas naejangsanensis]|uniref:helix-turn-helix domain-containing protein n=1 Tax=Brevundimonas naejangsanensis TaxID=588932 RepID=UPI003208FF07
MESKPNGASLGVLRPILTVAGQADFAEALKQRRLTLGLTQMELDHIAGFHDGYSAKLGRPFARTGRRSLKLTFMGQVWLEALGLKLAIVPAKCGFCAVSDSATTATLMDKDALLHPRPAHQEAT